MDKYFKYIGYVVISIFVAFLSSIGEEDFIANLSNSIVQVLIALLALYSTVSSLLISRLLSFRQEIDQSANITPVIESMKRNVRIEAILIICTLLVIVIMNVFQKHAILDVRLISVIRNTIVVFSLMYFVIVVYDSSMGLYDLLKFGNQNKLK